ncbi:MAG: hypothetical protein NW237_16380 [Cyanobacteriota bacterium]|nr:hypothetical protein [Cyanobacteriota bacterium]
MPTASQLLQASLRQQQQQGSLQLPALQRWEKGIPLWGEIIYFSEAEALKLRSCCQRSSELVGRAPQQGIQLCADFPELSRRLAMQIHTAGYGGLVQFEDLAEEDCFLRVVVGEGLYPVIVAQSLLKDFWMQLTLQACRHFLTVIDQGECLGFWESDLVLAR